MNRLAIVAAWVLCACHTTPPYYPSDASLGGDAGTCSRACGTACCTATQECDGIDLTCKELCTRACDGRVCGDDGCGGSCGQCPAGDACSNGSCVPCTPTCGTRVCGSNGCGGSCGSCPAGQSCSATGQCATAACGAPGQACCAPNSCSSSGCCVSNSCVAAGSPCPAVGGSCQNGSCGGCGNAGEPCCAGQCTAAGTVCSASTCESCGSPGSRCCSGNTCNAGATCSGLVCLACIPSCTGKSCGPDGCNGSCGTCTGVGQVCSAAGLCTTAVVPAPTNLAAVTQSTSSIVLTWTDNSTTETGFRIEHSLTSGAGFALAVSVGANVTTVTATRLSPDSVHYFRVIATGALGDSAPSNEASDRTFADVPAAPTALTATASGTSAINLSWTDYATNEQSFSIERAAAAAGPFAQVGTVSANVTTFANTGLATATAYFYRVAATNTAGASAYSNVASATTTGIQMCTFTVSVPATSSTGTYSLTWVISGGGLCSSNYNIQEAHDVSFSPLTGTYLTSAPATAYSFTGKADGTWCYRMSGGGAMSQPACITVARPTVGTLRIQNDTHYYLITIKLNGVDKISYPTVLDVRHYQDYVFAPGTVTWILETGFYDSSGLKQPWFNFRGTSTIAAGQTTVVSYPNPTISQVLGGFNDTSGRYWDGYYFDANNAYHTASYLFRTGGPWTFYNDGVSTGTGTVSLSSWPDYSNVVTFRTCATCTDIQLWYPFGSFQYRNGPASWPIIEYTAR